MGKNKKVGNSLSDLINLDFGEKEVKEMPENNEKYANAPYNFIEFPDRVVYRYDNIEDLPKHDKFCDKSIDKNGKEVQYNTGYIKYEFTNETPLYIGSGVEGEHFKVNGNHVIPGSTMRGRVRSNAEVLSFSYPQFVEDRRFLYRDIAGETISKIEYYERLNEAGAFDISDKVKAGYIKKENGNYYIYKVKEEKEKTFRLIDEFKLKSFNLSGNIKHMYNDELKKILRIDNEIEKIDNNLRSIWCKSFKNEEKKEIYQKLKKELGELYSKFTMNIKNQKIDYNLNKELKVLKKEFSKNRELIKEKRKEIYQKLKDKFSIICLEFDNKLEEKLSEDNLIELKENLKLKLKERGKKELEWRKVLEEKVNRREKILCYETEENIRYLIKPNGGIDVLGMELDSNLKGVLLNSQYIDGKKKHYFIFGKELDENKEPVKIKNNKNKEEIIADNLIKEYEKELENKIFDNYTKDAEKRKINNKIIRKFYSLPNEGETKVIFYKLDDDGNVKYFGRNPFLRMFYDCSTKDLLDSQIEVKKDKIDYAEAIFGFTNKEFNEKKISYKGRVNFGDVKIDKPRDEKEIRLALMSPKPTSFQLYLEQEKNNPKELNTYNKKDAKLRGQKFYWLRENADSESTEGKSIIKPIENGAKFKGRIYFENLTDDELGLLLLSLKYDDSTTDNIGMAKPYGYGKIEIEDIELVIEKKKESFKDFFFKENNDSEKSIEEYKKDFKNKFLEIYGNGKEVDTSEYEKMKIIDQYKISKKNYKGKEELKYMGIKEFSDRKPLKDINDYVKESKK